MSKILVLGYDGYIGHALTLRLLKKGYFVVGVDDCRRRCAVEEMGSFSATPILEETDRIAVMKQHGDLETHLFSVDNNYDYLRRVVTPDLDCIVNLAQQPSAPYSHKTLQHARNTTICNLIGTLNVLHAMYENAPDVPLVQIGTMGEYDPTLNVDIPEGVCDLHFRDKKIKDVIFPRRPGSWYHVSKTASTYYIDCACRWWGLKVTDIMQGVVYGAYTPEIEKTKLYSRLDCDEAFGTVVHRFIIQALIGAPLTIYGEGDHKRGFLAINDSIQCLMLAITNPPEVNYRTWNQLDAVHTMNEIAEMVQKVGKKYGLDVKLSHLESPRVEITNDHYYKPIVEKLRKIGFSPTRTLEQEISYLFSILKSEKLQGLMRVVIPKINWR